MDRRVRMVPVPVLALASVPALAAAPTPPPNLLPVRVAPGAGLLLGDTRSAVYFAIGQPVGDEATGGCTAGPLSCGILQATWAFGHGDLVVFFRVGSDAVARPSDRVCGLRFALPGFGRPGNSPTVAQAFADGRAFLPPDARPLGPQSEMQYLGNPSGIFGQRFHSDILAGEVTDPLCYDGGSTAAPAGTAVIVVFSNGSGEGTQLAIETPFSDSDAAGF